MKSYISTIAAAAVLSMATGAACAQDSGESVEASAGKPTSPLLHAVEGKVSANIDFTTDYRFRGISQTDRDFAVQGGFDYASNSGVYLGTWASNVDNFAPSIVDGDNGAQTEVDLYGGYNYNLTKAVALDANVLYYYYPGASQAGGQKDINYIEYTPSVAYSSDIVNAKVAVSYSPDYYAGSGHAWYYNGTASFPLASWVTLDTHVGYQNIEDNAQFGTPSYYDWSLGLETDQFGLTWKVSYIDTSIDNRQCFGGDNLCGGTAVGTISKSF